MRSVSALMLNQSSLPLYKVKSLSWINAFSSDEKPEILAHADVKIEVLFGSTIGLSVDEEGTINS